MEEQLPRVLMLGKGWFPAELGGLDRFYRELLERLPEARGVVVGPAPGSEGVRAASHHEAPLPLRLAAFWLAAWRAAPESDIVDAHFALYALLCVRLGRLRRRPLLVHFQGPWSEESVIQGDDSPYRRVARSALEKLVYRRAAVLVTLSGAFRRLLIERYGVSPWSVVVQPPGVDLGRFSPGDREAARDRFGVASDAFVVSCVRRLVPRMGLSVLLQAWEQPRSQGRPWWLLIAGDGELHSELQCEIDARGLGGSVRLLGRVGDEELVELYRAADLNVVPTLCFEGFGLVVAEAAGCGTPSVVTRSGGLPEAVFGLGDGLVVEPRDVQALSERLQAAAAGALPSRDSTRAWAARYDWSRVVDAHRTLHRRILKTSSTARPPRVVYLDHVARLSGGEIALQRLLAAFGDSVEAHVILGEEGPLVDRLIEQGTSVEVLPMASAARNVRKDSVRPRRLSIVALAATALYVIRLAWRLRRIRPDLVHTNSLKAGIYGSLAARMGGVPVVWHVRDRIDTDYLPRFAVMLVRRMIRLVPNVVVTNSHATMASLGPRHRSSHIVYSVVPEVATVTRDRSRPGSGGDALRVGIVGRLAPWKGQHVFLDAFAQAFPDGPHRAVVVGTALFGEDAYEASLHQTAAGLGLSDRVEFCGFREDVMAELSRLDILVHASITAEPFGQVVLEGMAAGLPVLASEGGGPSEIITDGVNGVLYPRADASALAARLRELAVDEDRRRALGVAARRRALDFAPAVVAQQMREAYASAIQVPQE